MLKAFRNVIVLGIIALFASGCIISIGGSSANKGSKKGNMRSIDGNLRIGSEATVKSARVIDGSVIIGDRAEVGYIDVIDGDVRGGRDVIIGGDIEIIDGSARLLEGAQVIGSIRIIDGLADLSAVTVGGDLELTCASGRLDGTRIDGAVVVRKVLPRSDDSCNRVLSLELGPGTVIRELLIEGDVELIIDDNARVDSTSRLSGEN